MTGLNAENLQQESETSSCTDRLKRMGPSSASDFRMLCPIVKALSWHPIVFFPHAARARYALNRAIGAAEVAHSRA